MDDDREIDFIPDRLIEEPVVFRGMTDSELISIMVGATVFWVPVSVIMLFPFGKALWGLAIGFGLALLTLLQAGKRLQIMKRKCLMVNILFTLKKNFKIE